MTNKLSGWHAVAREIGDHHIAGWCLSILKSDDRHAIGDWLPAEAAAKEILRLRQSRDAAYTERDRLVQALSKLFPSYLCRHPESDEMWDADWRWIVVVQIPTGQASWHIHDSERGWFDHLEVRANQWDRHSTEEKYARLSRLPVRDERDEIERLRAEIQLLNTDRSIRDSEADGKRIAELMRVQAVKDAEIEKLRAEVEKLRGEIHRLQAEGRSSRLDVALELTRERDDARAELAKASLSRLDEFAKAALGSAFAEAWLVCARDSTPDLAAGRAAKWAVQAAQATIRAIDGAGGA